MLPYLSAEGKLTLIDMGRMIDEFIDTQPTGRTLGLARVIKDLILSNEFNSRHLYFAIESLYKEIDSELTADLVLYADHLRKNIRGSR